MLETSHPPNYYFPPDDVAAGALSPSAGGSFCEWKGRAHYFTVHGGDRVETDAAWAYATPSPAFTALTDHVAFYAGRMDACTVDGELVVPQPGGFYGGWITSPGRRPVQGRPRLPRLVAPRLPNIRQYTRACDGLVPDVRKIGGAT